MRGSARVALEQQQRMRRYPVAMADVEHLLVPFRIVGVDEPPPAVRLVAIGQRKLDEIGGAVED